MTRSTIARSAVLAATMALTAAALVVPTQADGRHLASGDSLPAVAPRVETPVLHDDDEGGNADADDPAIWRNAAAPGRNLVVATAKEGGLRVYDLDGPDVREVLRAGQPP